MQRFVMTRVLSEDSKQCDIKQSQNSLGWFIAVFYSRLVSKSATVVECLPLDGDTEIAMSVSRCQPRTEAKLWNKVKTGNSSGFVPSLSSFCFLSLGLLLQLSRCYRAHQHAILYAQRKARSRLRSHVVYPSVCPSVTLVDHDHIS